MSEKSINNSAPAPDVWIALAMAAAFLLLYLRTLCPTVYLGDSGEICTAIATGGVIHPPGYPLFSLLGRAALWLIPVGEPAFRIGCVTALAAGAAIGVLYLLAREVRCSPWSAAAGAAVFGGSYTFWSQATRVEVYSLHALLVLLALLGSVRYRRSGHFRELALVSLALSLGLAHHLTIVVLGPALLVLCGLRLWRDAGAVPRVLGAAALLAVGPSLYLLLLVWAQGSALQVWGQPDSLSLLWGHASARVYQGNLHVPDGAGLQRGLAQARALLSDNFPFLLFLLPLLGAWALWKRDRGVTVGLLLGGLVVGGYNLCYRINDLAGYYLVVWLVAAVLLAAAIDFLVGQLREGPSRSVAAAVACAVAFGMPLVRNWAHCDLSRATWVREFSRHKLEHADRNAVLITQGDQDTFPLWYVHDVLKVRPDVLPIDRAMTIGMWSEYDKDPSLWYIRRLRRQGVAAPMEAPADPGKRAYWNSGGYLPDLLTGELRDRPICITGTDAGPGGPLFMRLMNERFATLPQGVILRLQPRTQPVNLAQLLYRNEKLWGGIVLPDLRGTRMDQELDPSYVRQQYAHMLVNFGGLYEMSGDRSRAEAVYQRVEEWTGGFEPAQQALAALRRGTQAQAEQPRTQPDEKM